MIAAYFGGTAADRRVTYELILEQRGPHYRVFARMGEDAQAPPKGDFGRGLWAWLGLRSTLAPTRQLYYGRDSRRALMTLLRCACAANLAELGQRFCFVLPSVPANPASLAVVIPSQLRHDGSLPFHPQLWQAGRALDTLPIEYHARASTDVRAFGDERKPLVLPPEQLRP